MITREMIGRTIATLAAVFCAAWMSGCLLPGQDVPAQSDDAARAGGRLIAPLRISPRAEEGVNENTLLLSWTRVTNAEQYQVYLGVDSNPPMIAVVTGTMLQVRDLPACAEHYWRVVATAKDGASISTPTWRFKTRCAD